MSSLPSRNVWEVVCVCARACLWRRRASSSGVAGGTADGEGAGGEKPDTHAHTHGEGNEQVRQTSWRGQGDVGGERTSMVLKPVTAAKSGTGPAAPPGVSPGALYSRMVVCALVCAPRAFFGWCFLCGTTEAAPPPDPAPPGSSRLILRM